ncbi:hypothetical protein QTN47_23710 [Danxiaibacter flavus]|uniref:DUF3999 family protein n=1 Tax=Danxiaibacter flavus TaxID=3049108 RepID=A0ABV3ZM19_9BACT|nr:hypothetical protein QNM32_23715 [Chitinophagaceae bacterium DXS]
MTDQQKMKSNNLLKGHFKAIMIVVASLVAFAQSSAQHFKYEASVQKIDSSGFYAINITPELSSHIKNDFSDIRIMDDHNTQVPFLIRNTFAQQPHVSGVPMPIVQNRTTDSGRSEIIIQNRTGTLLNEMTLQIKNADVQRYATLRGSNDEKQWFTILENINFKKDNAGKEDFYLQDLSFPANQYAYFKLIINNGKEAPLQILSATTQILEKATPTTGAYIATPQLSFVQKDSSDKNTYITVTNENFYHIEKVALAVEAPKFFKRKITISNVNSTEYFELSSNIDNSFVIPAFNTKKFIIKIENEDNPPLVIKSLHTYQSAKELIAYLDAKKSYSLFMGDPVLQSPSYELQSFKDSIPAQIKRLAIGEIKSVQQPKSDVKNSVFLNKGVLWVTLAIVLAILLFFTLKLTKQVRKP